MEEELIPGEEIPMEEELIQGDDKQMKEELISDDKQMKDELISEDDKQMKEELISGDDIQLNFMEKLTGQLQRLTDPVATDSDGDGKGTAGDNDGEGGGTAEDGYLDGDEVYSQDEDEYPDEVEDEVSPQRYRERDGLLLTPLLINPLLFCMIEEDGEDDEEECEPEVALPLQFALPPGIKPTVCGIPMPKLKFPYGYEDSTVSAL